MADPFSPTSVTPAPATPSPASPTAVAPGGNSPASHSKDKKKQKSKRVIVRPKAHEEDGEGSWLVSYADMMTLLVGFFILLQSSSKVDTTSYEKMKREATKIFGGQYSVPFEDLSKALKSVASKKKISEQIFLVETDSGIEVSFKGALFFDSGSAELRPQAADILNNIVPLVMEHPGEFGITIEGHTDDVPASGTRFPSNWELSSTRACSVLRLFEQKNFPRQRLKAIGWADTHPIVPNKDEMGKPSEVNRAQNRRVVIKIQKNFEHE